MRRLQRALIVLAVCALAAPVRADCPPGSAESGPDAVRCLAERLDVLERQLADAVVTFEAPVCPRGWIAYDPNHPLLPTRAAPGASAPTPPPLILCRRLVSR